jgi:hypothetical protein
MESIEAFSLIFSDYSELFKLPQCKWHLGLQIAVLKIRDSDHLVLNLNFAGYIIHIVMK